MSEVWHGAYIRWYDHREAGHRVRTAVWGWIADRLVNIGDLTRWPFEDRTCPHVTYYENSGR